MYLKRNNAKNFWGTPRKGTTYLAIPSHNKRDSVPLLVVMRDLLKLVRAKKELQRSINEKQIRVNNQEIRDVNYPISIFDIITIVPLNKNFRATLSEYKKIMFKEVSDKDAESRIYKVIGKKILSGKKQQLNLLHGKNIQTDEKADTGDSILYNLKQKKLVKALHLEKGKGCLVIKGKHAGNAGKIEEIIVRGGKQLAKIKTDKEKINVWTKNIIITD